MFGWLANLQLALQLTQTILPLVSTVVSTIEDLGGSGEQKKAMAMELVESSMLEANQATGAGAMDHVQMDLVRRMASRQIDRVVQQRNAAGTFTHSARGATA